MLKKYLTKASIVCFGIIFYFSSIKPASALSYKEYVEAIDDCYNNYSHDSLLLAGCIADAAADYLLMKIPLFSSIPQPLDDIFVVDSLNILPNEDIGSIFNQEVSLSDNFALQPTGINGFNDAVGNPTTPANGLNVFVGLVDDLINLDANQGTWTSVGNFSPGTSNWDISFDTSFLQPDSNYIIAYTFESDPNLFFPDASVDPTAFGVKVLSTTSVPESSSTPCLLAIGLLGVGSSFFSKMKQNKLKKKIL